MSARNLDGKATAAEIRADLTKRVAALAERGRTPGLGTVLVGDDPASHIYVNGKHRDCAQVGITSIRCDLPSDASQQQVEDAVAELNADPACTGFIVQLPLPRGLDPQPVLNLMDPAKDADGLHPVNLGRLVLGQPGPLPCTPNGIVLLLRRFGVPIDGADVTVIGRGITVGRTMGLLLTPDMVRPGAAVVDTGQTRTDAGLAGDVDPAVAGVAGWLTPVPGGVGPMTRAMLLANVVDAAESAG